MTLSTTGNRAAERSQTMTKKDYELIAYQIRLIVIHPWAQQDTVKAIANSIANGLEQDNPRFDRDRFLTACGIEQEEGFCETCRNGVAIPETEPTHEDSLGKHRVCPDCGGSADI